jgi:Cof subfamily protein (haloacid dehalogenase superfamily)
MNDLLRHIRVVLMDVDGTLIRGSADAIDNVVAQLRKLKPLGIRFSIATGRTLFGAQRIIREFSSVRMRMPPMIAYNGSVIAWPDESVLLHRFSLPVEPTAFILKEFRRRQITPLVYTCKERFDATPVEQVFGDSASDGRPATEFNGMAIAWCDRFDDIPSEEIVAILGQLDAPVANIRELVADLQHATGKSLRITSSGDRYIEVAHPESTKANALRVLSRNWGVDTSQIMAIGDNYNDLEMLAECGVGVAVANAPVPVQRQARYVCQREAAEGVVEALRLLITAIRHDRIESRVGRERNDA